MAVRAGCKARGASRQLPSAGSRFLWQRVLIKVFFSENLRGSEKQVAKLGFPTFERCGVRGFVSAGECNLRGSEKRVEPC